MDSEFFKNNQKGFTLIELVVSIALSLIIIMVLITIFFIQRTAFDHQQHISGLQQNIRAAMDMMTREIKMAGYDPAGTITGFNGIIYDTSQIRILADLDGSGTTTSNSNEDITYRYYDENDADYPLELKRKTGSGGSFQPFTEDIKAFTFSYLDANGAATTTSSGIRQVQITITGRTARPHPVYGYMYGTLTSVITPKNLGF